MNWPDAFNLSGRTAVVTGSGRGLGRAIARGLAAAGANLVLAARTLQEVESACSEIQDSGGRALALRCDIRQRDDCRRMIDEALAVFGSVDIAVCNAAAGIHGPAANMPEADWDKVMATSLTGYFNVAQAAGRQMIQQGKGGAIVMVSANSSVVGYSELAAAGAAKGGVDQLVRTLAVEWGGHGIRVNSVNPGYTEHVPGYGDVSPGLGHSLEQGVRQATPLERRAHVAEIVWPTVFLAGPAAGFITGASLMVDGGYSIK